MANQYGIDYGNVLRTKMAADKFQADMEDRETAKQRNALISSARSSAATGTKEGMTELLVVSPQEALAMQTYLQNASDQEREEVERVNDMGARMAMVVLTSDKKEETYQMMRDNMPEGMKEELPKNFSQDFMEMMLARATEYDQMIKNPEVLTMGDEDIMFQRGREVDRTPSNALLNTQV